MAWLRTISVFLLAAASACGSSSNTMLEEPDAGTPGCSPLIGGDCLSPYPSTFHMVEDPTSATGYRVHLLGERLPVSRAGVVFDPVRLNRRDGFSAATTFVVHFPQRLDPTGFPGHDQAELARSVTASSPVQLIHYDTGERVPLFAELDVNAEQWDRQALLIHPMIRLQSGARYVVALVGLQDTDGAAVLPAPFQSLRDKAPATDALAAMAERYDEIFDRLEQSGIARDTLSLAWDVIIGTDEQTTGQVIAMRDTALSMADAGELDFTIVSATDTPSDSRRMREVHATVQVPSFLQSDDDTALMLQDENGTPQVRGVVDIEITIGIPRCAETSKQSLPFVVFGHGLFGNARDTLSAGLVKLLSNELCMIIIGTDWIGLASGDLLNLSLLASNVNQFYFVTDRLQQAQVNAHVMTRLFASQIVNDRALAVGNRQISDGTEAYYFGISNGGIQGGTFMALSPDIHRGVLNVPGSKWSLMIYRSTHFNQLIPLLNTTYDEALDRQMLIAMSQFEWDYSDPITYAPYLLAGGLSGSEAKQIIVQESIGDAQVPNVSTRLLARTMGLPAFAPVEPVFGIDEVTGPSDSAYTQWDSHPTPLPPTGNKPAESDNGAHGAIQGRSELREQLSLFFQQDGQAVHTCDGSCSF